MIRESLAWISALFTQNRSGFGNVKKAKVVGLWFVCCILGALDGKK